MRVAVLLGERQASASRHDHAPLQATGQTSRPPRDRPTRRSPQLRERWRNAKIDWKALSKRIGHADVAFTMKQYVQTDLDADREVANTLAHLIIGGLLVTEIDDQGNEPNQESA
jgi:hypothetical protein